MSISHRTNRLKLVGQPSVEQLQNGRYRLTVNCTALNTRNDWYNANKDRIFPDYGSLQSAEMSIDGLAPREGEAYTDMRLTKVESGNQSMRDGGDYLVVLTYETLGSAFVQVKDDTTDYELNGLRRVTRTSIAEVGTDYAETVGSSYIDHQINSETAVRCYLASYSVDDTDSFRQVQEVYVEAGILSETLDNVGSQKAKVIETIGTDPSTPSGYVLASKQESDFEGFQTNRFTFLKPDVNLSKSIDKVGSQNAIIEEWFNPDPENDRNVKTDYSLAREEISDISGIKTNRYTFLKDNVELSRSEDKVGSQLAITTEVFNPDGEPAEEDYSVARTEISDVEGIPTKRFTFLKDGVELSRSEDFVGSQLAITTEVFKPTEDPTEEGYSVARTEVSDVDGIPTERFTFLKDDVELFHSEDLEGGLNEIVEEWFNPDPANNRDEKEDYVLIEKTESDVGGIPTERYTFWKEKGLIDESYVNEAEGVIRTTQVFFSEVDDELVIGPVVSKDTKNIDGIPTITVTTLQGSKGVSIIGEDERLANSYDQLVSFTYPGVVSIQSNPVGPLYTSYAWRLSPPVECVVNATTYVIFQDSNNIVPSDYTYGEASGHWNPTEWAKGESYGLGYGYKPFSESKGFRGYRADAVAVQVYEDAPDNYLINGNRLYENTTGGLNIYGGPENPNGKKYVLDVKITPAFVDVDGSTNYKKVIVVATIPQQEETPVPEAEPPVTPEP